MLAHDHHAASFAEQPSRSERASRPIATARRAGTVKIFTTDDEIRRSMTRALSPLDVSDHDELTATSADATSERAVFVVDAESATPGTQVLTACYGRQGIIVLSAPDPDAGNAGRRPRVRTFERGASRQIAEYIRGLLHEPDEDLSSWILGESENIRKVREQVRRVSQFRDVPVLVLGETGTGKDVVARAIHRLSTPDAPYVPVNSAAIPESLFESELFGHEAGSYTGARAWRGGLLEMAGGGTLFLDEIGDMPPILQPKLLRAVESRTYRRVGSDTVLPFRARIISATHRQVDRSGSAEFRSDLLFRLAGFVIELAPLRRRVADILPLSRAFLTQFASRHDLDERPLSPEAERILLDYPWPGNVRQLRTALEHSAILAGSTDIRERHLQEALFPSPTERISQLPPAPPRLEPNPVDALTPPTLRAVEADLIRRAWEQNDRNVSRTARQLGIARSTLRDRLKRYDIAID